MSLAPPTRAIGKGAYSATAWPSPARSGRSTAFFCRTSIIERLFGCLRFGRRFVFLGLAWTCSLRDSRDQSVVVGSSWVDDDHPFFRDHIFADIFAVIAAAHFNYHYHLAKLPIDFHVTQADNVVGQK